MNKIDPNASVMPIVRPGGFVASEGLSIRAELAARFMAALLSTGDYKLPNDGVTRAASLAVIAADALIAELNTH